MIVREPRAAVPMPSSPFAAARVGALLDAVAAEHADRETNEAPVAYVILRDGAAPGEEELRGFCHGRIASFKLSRAMRPVDDVPPTPGPHNDKAQKGKLREHALAEFGLVPS